MRALKLASLEATFILVFGVFHFAIPFILPPNFSGGTTLFAILPLADFVLPGCFALAILSILFYATKNRYPAAVLAFLFGGGITFHVLYLSGVFPPVIVVPDRLFLVFGIVIDVLAIFAVYDYYRRLHSLAG